MFFKVAGIHLFAISFIVFFSFLVSSLFSVTTPHLQSRDGTGVCYMFVRVKKKGEKRFSCDCKVRS
jgi:hypothetical protein